MKGDGSIRLRGGVYWITYNRDGKRFRVSARTSDENVAAKKLQAIRRQIERGELQTAGERRVTVGDLLDDLLTHFEVRGVAYARRGAPYHLKPLRKLLGDVRAGALETAMVERYQKIRKEDGRQPATINRECELLRQAYRLAARRQPPKVRAIPYIPMLPVQNARQGFLEAADFAALLEGFGDPDIRDFVEWFWWTGMRPGEIRQLSWDMLERGDPMVLHLAPTITKTRRPRSLAITGPIAAILERRLERRRLDCPLIFQRRGRPIVRFTTSWRKALAAAKLPAGLRPYDLRRSAIRNHVRAGVDPRTVMTISGHRTRSTFDRYNITSVVDVKEAIERTAVYVGSQTTKRRLEPMQKRRRH